MKAPTHINLAVFLGLVGYTTYGLPGALVAFLFHVLPLADSKLRWKLRGEWMHTITAVAVTVFLTWLVAPQLAWLVLISHGLHLVVDLFVDERLPYLWPFSKQGFAFPFPDSELYVNVMSVAGTLGMLLILAIR